LVDIFSDIIKRCCNGDRSAQEAIYNLLSGKMFAVCLRYCPNYEDARDLLHDGFITVFAKIGQFRGNGSFEGWVRRIFVNHAIEWYRNQSKLGLVMVSDWCENNEYFVENDDYNNSSSLLSENELLEMVQQLPQKYKLVFNLYVIDGLSHKEISKNIGISESTSRSNLLRARSILQKQVLNKLNSNPQPINATK
jgi:RNA polymerase sigma-70 factor (ECF subfamily)